TKPYPHANMSGCVSKIHHSRSNKEISGTRAIQLAEVNLDSASLQASRTRKHLEAVVSEVIQKFCRWRIIRSGGNAESWAFILKSSYLRTDHCGGSSIFCHSHQSW